MIRDTFAKVPIVGSRFKGGNIMKNIMKKMGQWIAAKSLSVGVGLYLMSNKAFASNISSLNSAGTVDIQWPWMKFFNSLADNLTGPTAKVLGVFGIVASAVALFSGHAGGGTQKFILLVFVISICLFAVNFVDAISSSAGGLTIMGL